MAVSSGGRTGSGSFWRVWVGRGGYNSDINVTPMADVMLVLLIIFMITAPLLQEGIYINKAKAENARAAPELEAENVVTVTITRDQIIYVQAQAVPEEELVDWISEYMTLAEGKPLFVRGDIAAPYGKVVEVINKARDAGVERIGLVVDRETKKGERDW